VTKSQDAYTAGKRWRAASAMTRSRCSSTVLIWRSEQTTVRYAREGLDGSIEPLVHKTERPRDDGLRLETIITRRAAPGYVLVRSHQYQPASVDRDEIRLIEP
jgi:hypothetical protein